MKRIAAIGVEIEGGWDRDISANIYYDGSVEVDSDRKSGEICSPPLRQLRQAESWIAANYPDHTNSTCGLHVHISLKKNLDYSKLMSEEFYAYFLEGIKFWAEAEEIIPSSPFWSRLAGANSYCKKIFCPDAQIVRTDKSSVRYAHLNYCFALHGTLECRLFPAWKNAKIAVSCLRAYIHIVEFWLALQPKETVYTVEADADEEIEKITLSEAIDDAPEIIREEICV